MRKRLVSGSDPRHDPPGSLPTPSVSDKLRSIPDDVLVHTRRVPEKTAPRCRAQCLANNSGTAANIWAVHSSSSSFPYHLKNRDLGVFGSSHDKKLVVVTWLRLEGVMPNSASRCISFFCSLYLYHPEGWVAELGQFPRCLFLHPDRTDLGDLLGCFLVGSVGLAQEIQGLRVKLSSASPRRRRLIAGRVDRSQRSNSPS